MLLAALPPTWWPFVTTNPIELNHWQSSSTKCAKNKPSPSSATTISTNQQFWSQWQPPFPHRTNNNHIDSTNLSDTIIKSITATKIKEYLFVFTATDQVIGIKTVTKVMTCNYWNRQGHLERECRTKQCEVGQRPQVRMAQLQQNPPSSSEEMYLFNTNLTNTAGLDLLWCCVGGWSQERLHPPHNGVTCEGAREREREREKERQMKNDTKCEREKFTIPLHTP